MRKRKNETEIGKENRIAVAKRGRVIVTAIIVWMAAFFAPAAQAQ